MPRAILSASAAVLIAVGLAACTTSAPEPTPSPTPSTESEASGGTPTGPLPTCAAVAGVIAPISEGLEFSEAVSSAQTAEEAYEQRVCVFVSPDGATQLGVTIAMIAFQQQELDAYSTLPGAIADERLGDSGAVLQTLDPDDRADGHLGSSLFLFDTTHSITIQGYSTAGELPAVLPALTVDAALDAAFAVRGLL